MQDAVAVELVNLLLGSGCDPLCRSGHECASLVLQRLYATPAHTCVWCGRDFLDGFLDDGRCRMQIASVCNPRWAHYVQTHGDAMASP